MRVRQLLRPARRMELLARPRPVRAHPYRSWGVASQVAQGTHGAFDRSGKAWRLSATATVGSGTRTLLVPVASFGIATPRAMAQRLNGTHWVLLSMTLPSPAARTAASAP